MIWITAHITARVAVIENESTVSESVLFPRGKVKITLKFNLTLLKWTGGVHLFHCLCSGMIQYVEISVIRDELACGTHGASGKWRNVWILEREREMREKRESLMQRPICVSNMLAEPDSMKNISEPHPPSTIGVSESGRGEGRERRTQATCPFWLWSIFQICCFHATASSFSMQKKEEKKKNNFGELQRDLGAVG